MVMKANSESITTVRQKKLILNILIIQIVNYILKDPEKFVEQLLELFNRFTKLVEDTFDADPRFMTSRDKVRNLVIEKTGT